jgi:hypothetical protein
MNDHVFEGPHWYRDRVRKFGPLLALVVPSVLGAVAVAALGLFDGLASGWTSLILGVCAAPGLLAIGAPFASTSTYPVGIAISVVLWLVVGVLSARIATRNPVATFTDFWRAYRWLAVGVWIGALAALAGSSLVLGRDLL